MPGGAGPVQIRRSRLRRWFRHARKLGVPTAESRQKLDRSGENCGHSYYNLGVISTTATEMKRAWRVHQESVETTLDTAGKTAWQDCPRHVKSGNAPAWLGAGGRVGGGRSRPDRKSTRLNSSHLGISYGGFC